MESNRTNLSLFLQRFFTNLKFIISLECAVLCFVLYGVSAILFVLLSGYNFIHLPKISFIEEYKNILTRSLIFGIFFSIIGAITGFFLGMLGYFLSKKFGIDDN